MRAAPNSRLVQKLVDGLSRRYSTNDRTGIHVSDLVLCLRKVYYTKVNPRQPTPETLGYYVDGSRRDIIIKGLLGPDVGPTEKYGIWFRPDSVDEVGNPIEVKTTRTFEGISRHYITQLTYYMVLMGTNRGWLVIQRVGLRRNDSPFEAYEFELEPSEMIQIQQEMIEKRNSLANALEQSDPRQAPSVRFNAQFNWLCKSCPWNAECKAIDEERAS